jgi:hypothetical protein
MVDQYLTVVSTGSGICPECFATRTSYSIGLSNRRLYYRVSIVIGRLV